MRWFSWSAVAVLILLLAVLIPRFTDTKSDSALTIYCAHDSIFADEVIRLFEQRTGITVRVRYDEEANKSLGLTNLLIQEKQHPLCDVFWNNQVLGTIRLREQGVLEPYRGAGYQRIPSAFRDPEGYWTGFGARMRVLVVNTEQMQATEEAIREQLDASSLSQVAIAVPLFGTTLTHYASLAAELGIDGLKDWHRALRDRGIREARGNGAVKDLVAAGTCHLGFTDTDDVFVAMDQGQPVRMLPARLPSGKTIVIPNSVALIRGAAHPDAAQRFIEFLLSEEVELMLARSGSRQIPLGPVGSADLPEAVRELMDWAADGASMEEAAHYDQAVLDWLSAEYLQQ